MPILLILCGLQTSNAELVGACLFFSQAGAGLFFQQPEPAFSLVKLGPAFSLVMLEPALAFLQSSRSQPFSLVAGAGLFLQQPELEFDSSKSSFGSTQKVKINIKCFKLSKPQGKLFSFLIFYNSRLNRNTRTYSLF